MKNILQDEMFKIQKHHNTIITELTNYKKLITNNFQIYTEYEDIDGIDKSEFIQIELENMFMMLGETSALLYYYNEEEFYELSQELYPIIRDCFLVLYNNIYPNVDNEDKFIELLNKMFNHFKSI